jgi:hypothetical protein
MTKKTDKSKKRGRRTRPRVRKEPLKDLDISGDEGNRGGHVPGNVGSTSAHQPSFSGPRSV